MVHLSVCMPVKLVHSAKAVRQYEMPFGRDTCVAPSNIVFGGGPSIPTGRGHLGVGIPNRRDQSAAANSKHLNVNICVVAMLPIQITPALASFT